VPIKIRGVTFEENLDNSMGLEFYNLSHRFGYQSPNWPYFEDVKIERIHYMAKSGVLSQRITTSMHNTTHIDAPAHVVQGTPFIDEVPLPQFFGSGIVISLPKKMWDGLKNDLNPTIACVAVALLGRSHPAGIVAAAVLFGTLAQGGLAINAVVPKELVDVLQAVIILGVAAASVAGRPAGRAS
jgi:hypothetical protein